MNDQHLNAPVQEESDKKGAVCMSMGAILFILGALDCVLAWRGAFDVSNFYIAFLVMGASLYSIGMVRAAKDSD